MIYHNFNEFLINELFSCVACLDCRLSIFLSRGVLSVVEIHLISECLFGGI